MYMYAVSNSGMHQAGCHLNCFKDLLESSWNDPSVTSTAVHGMRLASTSLAIRKDSAVVPFQHAVHNWPGCFLINLTLRAGPVKHIVKCECFWKLCCVCCLLNNHLQMWTGSSFTGKAPDIEPAQPLLPRVSSLELSLYMCKQVVQQWLTILDADMASVLAGELA